MKRKFAQNWGLLILVSLWLVITYQSIKPSLFVMGWDNFSTNLNLSINLPRTLFATWRDYRGLGVASDSEVVDIVRQAITAVAATITNQETASQIYPLLNLIIGVTGVYLLAKTCFKNIHLHPRIKETAATTAGLAYLFNLNTLGVYHFPMPMFITRFGYLPWIALTFIKLIQQKQPSRKILILFVAITFLATPSYLTATLFITTILLLLVIGVSLPKYILTSVKYLLVFILINSFWLLPFANYTKEKSRLLPQASTFIEVNEIQLNEAPDHFNWENILQLYPSFFYPEATKLTTNQPIHLHPLADILNRSESQNLYSLLLWVFPLLYISGALIILLQSKKYQYLGWVPLLLACSLILLRKEYPPTGLVYEWLGNHLPFFKVIFRFGDTKFNNLVALGGSLSAAATTLFALEHIKHLLKKPLLYRTATISLGLILILTLAYPFQWFFQGKLISPLMYNRIPKAYQEIATAINQDPDYVRVLHLPFDAESYWRPYSWGYFGSTFLAFMLDKPLLERTFEPASRENDQVNQTLNELIVNSRNLGSEKALEERADLLEQLLIKTNTKYVILDGTINPVMKARSTKFWGHFPIADTHRLLEKLHEKKLLSLEKNYNLNAFGTISLYKLTTLPDQNNTPKEAAVVNNNQQNLLAPPLLKSPHTFQNPKIEASGLFYPFYEPQAKLEAKSDYFLLHLPNVTNASVAKIAPTQTQSKQTFSIWVRETDSELVVNINHQPYPFPSATETTSVRFAKKQLPLTFPAQTPRSFAADWHTLKLNGIGNLRLNVGGVTLPLPTKLLSTPQYLATVLTNQNPLTIHLLVPEGTKPIRPEEFTFTENPNCFNDAIEGYAKNLTVDSQDSLTLSTTNGTSCMTAPLTVPTPNAHVEVNFAFQHQADHNPGKIYFTSPATYHQTILETIESFSSLKYFTACIITPGSYCLNNHTTINATNPKAITIPAVSLTNTSPQLFITLPTINYQTNHLSLRNISYTTFTPIESATINVNQNVQEEVALTTPLTLLTLPKILSSESYYFNPNTDALRVFNQPCTGNNQYHTIKSLTTKTIWYTNNCSSGGYVFLPFNSDNAYLWQVTYNLASGKFPKFSLQSAKNIYKNQYLSLNQGYPNLPGFKFLQTALPFWWTPSQTSQEVIRRFETGIPSSTYTYLYPRAGLNEDSIQAFTLTQNSQNQGIFTVSDFNVLELPPTWVNLSLESANSKLEFAKATITTYRIVPSLWKITLQPITDDSQPVLLPFSQAYDSQWHLFRTASWLDTLLNLHRSTADHVKVNGFTNGWIIPSEEQTTNNSQPTTFYAFYIPERLSLLGWLITFATTAVLLRKFPSHSHHRQPTTHN